MIINSLPDQSIADSSTYGVMKIGAGLDVNQNGVFVKAASSNQIKAGNQFNTPIVPAFQEESVFYGLAKLAGQDMASSSNPVGTFTDAAKKAIKRMLGIYDEWELIVRYTGVTEDVTTLDVDLDSNGQEFELKKAFVYVRFPEATTAKNDYVSAYWTVKLNNGTYTTKQGPTGRYAANGIVTYFDYDINIIDNLLITRIRSQASGPANTQGLNESFQEVDGISAITGVRFSQYNATSTLIPEGTIVTIYGVRA